AFRREDLLVRALDQLRQGMLPTMALQALASTAADPMVGDLILRYLAEHREAIIAAAGPQSGPFLPLAFSLLCDSAGLVRAAEFGGGSGPALDWARGNIQFCIEFARHHRDGFHAALGRQ